ncbi:MAG: 4-(cytidine 5'-diphospho)-2-C-methyl-D-erythritol kinase [Lachnospiraceae bacterium]|jgi:4-diphosphocytidyl-2-C-methyl-D-erythritol kinase|nr:4-(cytidine 5'-diphospho)-2-C-methyl-D-erythritol kinase [Lachnospiraceae bacterium]
MGRSADFCVNAYAKINLGLDVLRKREDGYHEVRMIMQTVRLHDRIWLRRRREPGICLESNLSFLPVDKSNLAYRAAALVMEEAGIREGLSIYLDKRIPVAAGMAGGSADCAAVLWGVNRIYRLGLSMEQLRERGVKLGADVPYCLLGGTALAEGIGERLTPLPPAPGKWILIAKPSIGLSTRYIYEHLRLDEKTDHPDIDGMEQAIRRKDYMGIVSRLGNVLESAALPGHPPIGKLKQALLAGGARGALMSGSGPTVFGFFDDIRQAKRTASLCCKQKLARQVFVTEFYHRKT